METSSHFKESLSGPSSESLILPTILTFCDFSGTKQNQNGKAESPWQGKHPIPTALLRALLDTAKKNEGSKARKPGLEFLSYHSVSPQAPDKITVFCTPGFIYGMEG